MRLTILPHVRQAAMSDGVDCLKPPPETQLQVFPNQKMYPMQQNQWTSRIWRNTFENVQAVPAQKDSIAY